MAKLKERYASVLLEISLENSTLKRDLEQAIMIRDIIDDDDVKTFLVNPHISDLAKRQLFHKAFSEKINWHLMSFLYLMVRNNLESLIIAVLDEYITAIKRRLGMIEAKVVSAIELTDKQIESIHKVLSKKINMDVEIKAKVDPGIIGGFYIVVDGRIFDSTVRTELNNMKESLKRGITNDS